MSYQLIQLTINSLYSINKKAKKLRDINNTLYEEKTNLNEKLHAIIETGIHFYGYSLWDIKPYEEQVEKAEDLLNNCQYALENKDIDSLPDIHTSINISEYYECENKNEWIQNNWVTLESDILDAITFEKEFYKEIKEEHQELLFEKVQILERIHEIKNEMTENKEDIEGLYQLKDKVINTLYSLGLVKPTAIHCFTGFGDMFLVEAETGQSFHTKLQGFIEKVEYKGVLDAISSEAEIVIENDIEILNNFLYKHKDIELKLV